MKILYSLLIAVILSGCMVTSTLEWSAPLHGQKSSDGRLVVWNLRGENNGIFLFNCIPLISGDAEYPNRMDYETFANEVHPYDMERMFRCRLKQLKADDVTDIRTCQYSTGVWTLWILWKRTVTGEAVAVKNIRKKGEK